MRLTSPVEHGAAVAPSPQTPSRASRRASGPHQLVARRRRIRKKHLKSQTVSTWSWRDFVNSPGSSDRNKIFS